MDLINQALFGYSNGHRLLASSIQLSTTSLRLLEMLSDLSGNEISKNTDGYYTGCWIPEEDYYVICKTWYATEMPRSGCAWTHAVFLDCKKYSTSINFSIDSLFQRPDKERNDFLNYYKVPLQVKTKSQNQYEQPDVLAKWLLNSIVSQIESIALCSDDTFKINQSISQLFELMGVKFFKNFTFCTASQTNRMIKEQPLNFQVFSSKVSKIVLRSLSVIQLSQINNTLQSNIEEQNYWLNVKQFSINSKKELYSFKDFRTIKEIYNALYNPTGAQFSSYIAIIKNSFASEQVLANFPLFLDVFITDSLSDISKYFSLTNLFVEISQYNKEHDDFVKTLNIRRYEEYLRELYQKTPLHLLTLTSRLLCSELNSFGEQIIQTIAFVVDSNALKQMFSEEQLYCAVLLQSNWRLAENALLWSISGAVQSEMLRNIGIAFNRAPNQEKEAFREVINLVYENCDPKIADEVYIAFGEFSISSYFEWTNATNSFNKERWVRICRKNPYISLCVFNSLERTNEKMFYTLLNTIDPWDSTMLSVKAKTLEELCKKYCLSQNNLQLNDIYAKFVLQAMINTSVRVSDEVANFVFVRTHRILEDSDFDSNFWNAISSHLPEVKWYNSWDKCKRLRKFAKKEGYTNIFM